MEGGHYSQVENDMAHMWRYIVDDCRILNFFKEKFDKKSRHLSKIIGGIVLSYFHPEFSECCAPDDDYKFHYGPV